MLFGELKSKDWFTYEGELFFVEEGVLSKGNIPYNAVGVSDDYWFFDPMDQVEVLSQQATNEVKFVQIVLRS